jgi:hypothetical protein
MKKTISTEKGIAPLLILIIAAIVVAGGAGTYQAVKKNKDKGPKIDVEVNATTTVQASGEATTTATSTKAEGKGNGTLRSLLARSGDVVCAVNSSVASGGGEGTVYISGGMMRGDFTLKSSNNASIESHMIKTGDTMYAWSGSQGVKMEAKSPSATSSAQAQAAVNLDQSFSYECKTWTKDASKFVVPTSVNFIDLNAMLKGQGNIQVPGVNVNAGGQVKVGI